MNVRKKKSISIFLICFVSFIFTLGFCFGETEQKIPEVTNIFNKPVHPREYNFNIYDLGSKINLKLNRDTGLLSYVCDFTKFVKEDMPQAGDKLIFHFKGYSYKEILGNLVGSLENSGIERVIGENLKEKEQFERKISFILLSNPEKIKLEIKCTEKQELTRISLRFQNSIPTTDTGKELDLEKKAIKKGMEIVPFKTEIIDDYDIKKTEVIEEELKNQNPPEKTPEEIQAEKDKLAFEEKRKAEQKEFERQQEEIIEHQKLLEETIQAISKTNVTRYEKEYLHDYAVSDYDEDEPEVPEKLNSFTNPDKVDDFNRTPLMKAAKDGNDWQIRALLNAGANVNSKDMDGWTPLMYAVRYQENMDCVNLLINAGADVKAVNNYGMSALVLAGNYNNNPEIIKKLLTYYEPTDKDVLQAFVLVLSESNDSEYLQLIKVNLFLDLSVPLNSYYNGKTPLMYAAESGSSTQVIKLLMDSNSITSIRSTEGKTAFDYAKENPKLKHDNIYWSLNNK